MTEVGSQRLVPRFNIKEMKEDLYSGYNEYDSAFETKNIENDEYLQEALRTSHGRRTALHTGKKTPGTALRVGTSSGFRLGTSNIFVPVTGSTDTNSRPMTAVRGAGYTSQKGPIFNATKSKSTAVFPDKLEETPEDKIKRLEKNIQEVVDESVLAGCRKEYRLALEKAKDASTKEKNLIRFQEHAGLANSHNMDIAFLVLFNLALQYENNEMYNEALNSYAVITRNRNFANANQLKVNMGNIYVKLGDYPKAIKTYRMALDQIPNTYKHMRVKIMHNIGILFVKMGQYSEACNSFENIMREKPDFRSGLHTILCYFAMGDKEKMKESFLNLLEIPLISDEEKYNPVDDQPQNPVLEVIRNDKLRHYEMQLKHEAEWCIMTAAKVISPVIDVSFNAGYKWCVDSVRTSLHPSLVDGLEINKSTMLLKQRDIPSALETLKTLEKRGSKSSSMAATNLSFIYYFLGDIGEAEKYAEQAHIADGYNAAAYVNLGNCSYSKGEYDKARDLYSVALENDPSSTEALYNLGVLNKKLGQYEEALECFLKLHAIMSSNPPVLYQLAHLHQLVGDIDQAIEWFLQLLSIEPADPSVLIKLGEIYDMDNDKQQAFHYYSEAYRYQPYNLAVLDWLGAYFVSHRVAEKAIPYYERAKIMQPLEPKWPLLIGSCHRRTGNYQQALKVYKETHHAFPENIECLKFLIRLCSDLGLKETTEYALELKKAEKARELRDRISSSKSGSRRSSSKSSKREESPATTESPVGRRGYPERLEEEQYQSYTQHIDTSYSDPLGPMPERPRTGMIPPRTSSKFNDDDFGDEEITDDLLPE